MIKLLDTMNIDNCRIVFESECVRIDFMLFEIDDIFCIFESRLISLDEYFIVDLKNSLNNVSIENL